MNDLLSEFVELAPKEWGAREFPPKDVVVFHTISRPCVQLTGLEYKDGAGVRWPVIVLEDDRVSAEAIVFLLDWLEESCEPTLRRFGDIYGCWRSDFTQDIDRGKTRIESVVRSVVKQLMKDWAPP